MHTLFLGQQPQISSLLSLAARLAAWQARTMTRSTSKAGVYSNRWQRTIYLSRKHTRGAACNETFALGALPINLLVS